MFCSQCGARLREDARFCPKCGAAVPQDAPSVAPPVPPAPREDAPDVPPRERPPHAVAVPRRENAGLIAGAAGAAVLVVALLVLLFKGGLSNGPVPAATPAPTAAATKTAEPKKTAAPPAATPVPSPTPDTPGQAALQTAAYLEGDWICEDTPGHYTVYTFDANGGLHIRSAALNDPPPVYGLWSNNDWRISAESQYAAYTITADGLTVNDGLTRSYALNMRDPYTMVLISGQGVALTCYRMTAVQATEGGQDDDAVG